MTEEEIEIIQLQSFEGLAAGLGDVFARQAVVVWSVGRKISERRIAGGHRRDADSDAVLARGAEVSQPDALLSSRQKGSGD